MAGEKINLDLGSMMGEVGQTISIEDDGQVTAMEQNNSENSDKEKQEEFKTGELVQLEDGSVVEYNSKKHKKKQQEEKETTEETDDTEKNKDTRPDRKKMKTPNLIRMIFLLILHTLSP